MGRDSQSGLGGRSSLDFDRRSTSFVPNRLFRGDRRLAARASLQHENDRCATTSVLIVDWLKQKEIDFDAIAGESTRGDYASKENYDRQELRIFAYILGASGVLVLIGLIFGGKP